MGTESTQQSKSGGSLAGSTIVVTPTRKVTSDPRTIYSDSWTTTLETTPKVRPPKS
jgi:hypothetical protein